MTVLPTLTEIESAAALVHKWLPPTPQFEWPLLSARCGCTVRGIVSATRGNHGQSLAFAARRHGIHIAIVVPHGNPAEKNAAMRVLGIHTQIVGVVSSGAVLKEHDLVTGKRIGVVLSGGNVDRATFAQVIAS